MRLSYLLAVVAYGSLPAQQSDVYRVSVDLVQVDAMVTDSKGRAVTNLRPEDFELRQDGKKQKLTHFSYVEVGRTGAQTQTPSLKPEDTRRIIALVVDDLGLRLQDWPRIRLALDRFVDGQMQDGDLVAIFQTGSGTAFAGRFTADGRALHAAVRVLKPGAANRAEIRFEPRPRGVNSDDARRWRASEESARAREEALAILTLNATSEIVRSMRMLPGRKLLVLFSDGLPAEPSEHVVPLTSDSMQPQIQDSRSRKSPNAPDTPALLEASGTPQRPDRTGVRQALSRLTLEANQIGATVYTITPSVTGGDFTGGEATDQTSQIRRPDLFQAAGQLAASNDLQNQAGLERLTRQTGGLSFRPIDFNDSLGRVMNDSAGFYLLGYRPPAGTIPELGAAGFHSIELKLRKSGLSVRTRSGFAGVPQEALPARRTPEEELAEALLSPFTSPGIRVRLTPLFRERNGLLVQSLVHIDAGDLQFTETEKGIHVAAVDLAIASLGEDVSPVGKVTRRFDLRLSDAEYKRVLETGVVYNLAHQVKPGAYQWRAAVRDVSSGRTGSARQFVEVPDLANGQLALGGILIHEANSRTDEDPRAVPAVRQFRLGSTIEYEYPVYNGRADLEVQARVYRDGTEVWASKPASLESSQGNGRLDPGTVSQSGQYTLVVTASECGTAVVARQSIDFEIAGTAPAETAAVAPADLPAPPPAPGTKLPADENLLARIRERAAQQIARRPNYTCLEDIERRRMHDGCPNCESSDNLRLEVAVVSGNERFAWPGSREFEDKDVADLVTTGMIGNGDFAGASDVVFFSKFTSYTFAGGATRAGRRALRIDYVVPATAQGFRLRSNDGEARVGFRGSFWVDAQTLDLVHLETHALDIPAALKISSAAMSIDYGSFPISGRDFLLPQMTELRMAMANGTETSNRTRFSACRQFAAESAIMFDPAAAQAKSPRPAAPLVELPPGLLVDARLAGPITIAHSAAGDPIQAVVIADAKLKGKVIVPKGAVLSGRIRHLSDHWGPSGFGEATALSNFTVIGFDFSTVSFAGTQAGFRAELTRYSGTIREPHGRLVPSETSVNDKSWGSTAILAFKQRMTEIPKGFWLRWRTIR